MYETPLLYELSSDGGKTILRKSGDEILSGIKRGEIKQYTLLREEGGEWIAIEKSIFGKEFEVLLAPPPPFFRSAPTNEQISDVPIWFMIGLSICAIFLATIIFKDSPLAYGIHMVSWGAFCVIAFIDGKALRRLGVKPPHFLWAGLLLPVYLYLRSKELKKRQHPLITWGILIAIFMFLSIFATPNTAALEQTAASLVSELLTENFPGSSAVCTQVRINRKISDRLYTATAYLDNGKTVDFSFMVEDNHMQVKIPGL